METMLVIRRLLFVGKEQKLWTETLHLKPTQLLCGCIQIMRLVVKVKNLQILIHNNFLKRLFWKSPRQINQILYPFKGFKLNWTAIKVEPVDCECSDIGTEEKNCESETEQCKCKPNYTGEKCEECKEDHWISPAANGGEFCSTMKPGSLAYHTTVG